MKFLYCLVLVFPLSDSAGYCEGGCNRNGHCYRHGDAWTENCIQRRCQQLHSTSAIVETMRVMCKDAYGRCVHHGDTMIVQYGNSIHSCRCNAGKDSWDYIQCSSGTKPSENCYCDTTDGCRSYGERWTASDCFTYQCQKNGNSWIGAVVGAACKDVYGTCRQNGEKFSSYINNIFYDDCICTASIKDTKYHCGRGNTKPKPDCTATGCTVDGVCHEVGSEWTKDCVTYRCDKLATHWRRVTPVRRKCKDAFGYCWNNGQVMSIYHLGRRKDNCVCKIVGSQIGYECTSWTK